MRVYDSFSGLVHRKRIEEQKQAADRAGLPDWRPKTFGCHAVWCEKRKDFGASSLRVPRFIRINRRTGRGCPALAAPAERPRGISARSRSRSRSRSLALALALSISLSPSLPLHPSFFSCLFSSPLPSLPLVPCLRSLCVLSLTHPMSLTRPPLHVPHTSLACPSHVPLACPSHVPLACPSHAPLACPSHVPLHVPHTSPCMPQHVPLLVSDSFPAPVSQSRPMISFRPVTQSRPWLSWDVT